MSYFCCHCLDRLSLKMGLYNIKLSHNLANGHHKLNKVILFFDSENSSSLIPDAICKLEAPPEMIYVHRVRSKS